MIRGFLTEIAGGKDLIQSDWPGLFPLAVTFPEENGKKKGGENTRVRSSRTNIDQKRVTSDRWGDPVDGSGSWQQATRAFVLLSCKFITQLSPHADVDAVTLKVEG